MISLGSATSKMRSVGIFGMIRMELRNQSKVEIDNAVL